MTRIIIFLILFALALLFLFQVRRRPKNPTRDIEPKANEALPTATGTFRAKQLLGPAHKRPSNLPPKSTTTEHTESFEQVESEDVPTTDIFEEKKIPDPFSKNK